MRTNKFLGNASLLRRRSLGSSRNLPPPRTVRGGGRLHDEPVEGSGNSGIMQGAREERKLRCIEL